MANKIKPKRSYTASSVPLASDLDTHELAINWADGKAYTKNAAGNIVSVTLGGGGSGGGSLFAAVTLTGFGDLSYSAVSLLLHGNGNLTDKSGTPQTVTAVGGAAATGAAKFGSASFSFSGSGQYLSVPYSSSLDLSSGDWTVECWANPSALRTGNHLFAINTDSSQFCQAGVVVNADGSAYFLCNTQGGGDWINTSLAPAGTFATNTWKHVAAVRSGSQFTLYVGGVSVISFSSSGTLANLSSPSLIGYRGGSNANHMWTGLVDEFRVTKAVRYTSSFTPPAAAFADSADLVFPVVFGTPTITISAQPSNQTASAGAATFSATASVTLGGSVTYQWQKSTNSGSTWADVSGATSSSLALSNLTNGADNSDRYRVVVSSTGASSVTSSAATLTVAVASSFTPTAVLLTSGTSYTVPSGASRMKAWAVGGGGTIRYQGGAAMAGGCAYKTWTVSVGQSVSYVVGSAGADSGSTDNPGQSTTVTFSGTTITGGGGGSAGNYSGGAGGFSGGDGGANGGAGVFSGVDSWGGAVGGNNGTAIQARRRRATDVSGLFAAVLLAGGVTSEIDAAGSPAFGSGAAGSKNFASLSAGLGGGGLIPYSGIRQRGGGGAVVLYFT